MKKPKRSHRLLYGQGSFYYDEANKVWIGVLEAGLDENGKRRRAKVSSANEDTAWKKLTEKIKAIQAGKTTLENSDATTLAQWCETWLEDRKAVARPTTYDNDKIAVNKHLLPLLGKKRLMDIDANDVRRLARKIREQGGSSTTIGYYQGRLQTILRDARREGYIVSDTAILAKRAEKAVNTRTALSADDATKILLKAIETLPECSYWIVAFLQGLRQGERLGLTWDRIDFVTNTITIDRQLQELTYADKELGTFDYPDGYDYQQLEGTYHLVPTKNSRGRGKNFVIPMIPVVRSYLLAWKAVSPPSPHGLVWPLSDGRIRNKKYDGAQWRKLQDQADVHKGQGYYVGHEIRNTTATLLLTIGVDPEIIKAIMGHSTVAMSMAYTRVNSGHMERALQGMAEALHLEAPPSEVVVVEQVGGSEVIELE
ncbi:tyrosine-type recombinase/integrase [Arcanobacterium phocae]|uniref:tyrosine-type recombinase/integrase n=1 Tax=Arcanobacterium phocae TaxID=131112 RepID=UPI001C0F0CEE|nr:site-specific integrase [Arcanobacterium phocae]